MSLGRFRLFKVAQFASIVRWNAGIDKEIMSGFVGFLVDSFKPKTSKRKNPSTSVTPPWRLPLVATQPALPRP